jgi:hypothetical protein
MKHPDREEWVPFVFGEVDSDTRQRLARHLEECPDCAREITGWRQSLRKLDRWPLPKLQAEPKIVAFQPIVRWALAASLVLGLGLLVGRMTSPAPVNAAELRSQVEASVRASLQANLQDALRQAEAQTAKTLSATEARLANASAEQKEQIWRGFVEVLNRARLDDSQSVQALLRQLQEQNETELVALRKDLETLASTADEQIRQARLKLIQLAANSRSVE